MVTMKEKAQNYEPQKTKTISDLGVFDADIETFLFEGTDKDGKTFTYEYVQDEEGNRYRVPGTVFNQMKMFLEEDPSISHFKVKKSGEGMKTSYTVMPVDK